MALNTFYAAYTPAYTPDYSIDYFQSAVEQLANAKRVHVLDMAGLDSLPVGAQIKSVKFGFGPYTRTASGFDTAHGSALEVENFKNSLPYELLNPEILNKPLADKPSKHKREDFRQGDRVRLVAYGEFNGKLGTVSSRQTSTYVDVKIDGQSYGSYLLATEIEMVKQEIRIGDYVTGKGLYSGLDRTGTVTKIAWDIITVSGMGSWGGGQVITASTAKRIAKPTPKIDAGTILANNVTITPILASNITPSFKVGDLVTGRRTMGAPVTARGHVLPRASMQFKDETSIQTIEHGQVFVRTDSLKASTFEKGDYVKGTGTDTNAPVEGTLYAEGAGFLEMAHERFLVTEGGKHEYVKLDGLRLAKPPVKPVEPVEPKFKAGDRVKGEIKNLNVTVRGLVQPFDASSMSSHEVRIQDDVTGKFYYFLASEVSIDTIKDGEYVTGKFKATGPSYEGELLPKGQGMEFSGERSVLPEGNAHTSYRYVQASSLKLAKRPEPEFKDGDYVTGVSNGGVSYTGTLLSKDQLWEGYDERTVKVEGRGDFYVKASTLKAATKPVKATTVGDKVTTVEQLNQLQLNAIVVEGSCGYAWQKRYSYDKPTKWVRANYATGEVVARHAQDLIEAKLGLSIVKA